MNATNFFDYVTLNLGWLINNTLWNIIATSGIVIIPFVLKLMAIFKKSREQGADEGNQGVLIINWLGMYVYMAIFVIFATCIPSLSPDFKILQYKQSMSGSSNNCTFNEVSIANSDYQGMYSQLNGQDIRVPVWWYGIHALSMGVTQAAITALPCNIDLRQVQGEIQSLQINDPILLNDVKAFYSNCFNPAYNKLRGSSSALTRDEAMDVSWPGSTLFLDSPGYYDEFRAQTPQKGWQYDNTRDVGLSPGEGYTGYPICKSWWSDSEVGLKDRLMQEVENQKARFSLTEIWYSSTELFSDNNERNETLLRSLLNPEKLIGTADNSFSDYSSNNSFDDKVDGFLSMVGTGFSVIGKRVEMDSLRQAAPMIQSVLFMSVIILLPIIITLGGFEPKVVITLTFVIFSIVFLSFVWELGRFLDSQLFEMVFRGPQVADGGKAWQIGPFSYDRDVGKSWIMKMITLMVFALFPALLLTGMSWTGIKVGGAISGALGSAGKQMEAAGKTGANVATTAVKTAATKGAGALKK